LPVAILLSLFIVACSEDAPKEEAIRVVYTPVVKEDVTILRDQYVPAKVTAGLPYT